ncbi:uncharacterized protein J7T54_002761 [Emericellopsis cladophorae]|uniref:Uncharacterized protein n=1 Tax=Emericellopsis cladophorae TaxID=2686198 RepID=A0A9P9XUK2_9HYPO|nr:uncharacterized protein J7T54_002761 [Emericellopsis cladophorae]KAI6777863.1 hypothetical protein J7T54_002761 [Emericellopsis cladophorae]
MTPSNFVFLNTTGASSLSKKAAKRVRGHVTKTNFANRRRLKAEADASKPGKSTRAVQKLDSPCSLETQLSSSSLAIALSIATSKADKQHAAELLNESWSVIFLHDRNLPGDEHDKLWLDTMASEPAFVEATMATAVRYWSPDLECKLRSEMHSHRATAMVISRVSSNDTYSNGFFGAVLTMALSERMVRNDAAWEVHMNGLAQTIKARQAHGIASLPALFTDLIILDTVNNIIGFPRVYHPNLVDLLEHHADGIIITTSALASHVVLLRRMVRMHRQYGYRRDEVDAIAGISEIICQRTVALEAHRNPGWDNAYELLETALGNDEDLLERFAMLWAEI